MDHMKARTQLRKLARSTMSHDIEKTLTEVAQFLQDQEGEIETAKRQGYVDGFKSATDIAQSVVLRVAPELDTTIELGTNAVTSILQRQLLVFEKEIADENV